MIGNPEKYLVVKLPRFMGYPLNSIVYLGKEHNFKVVKVVDILASSEEDKVIYLFKPLFWRSLYNRFLGL